MPKRNSSRQRMKQRKHFPPQGVMSLIKQVIKRFNSRYPYPDSKRKYD